MIDVEHEFVSTYEHMIIFIPNIIGVQAKKGKEQTPCSFYRSCYKVYNTLKSTEYIPDSLYHSN